MSAIHVEDLVAGYGGQPVLVDTSLHVDEGSLACVLGPSGCGKTTLLRVIAGFEPAQSGTVRIGDQVVDDGRQRLPAERRRVGYVPQEGAMFPHLSVADNVGFALPRRGAAARADRGARITELLSLIGMDGLGERYPHELSGGQQQRVAVAGRWPATPRWCCSTSRSPRSTRRCGRTCGTRSVACCGLPASRPCSSPTTAPRRSRSPTRWPSSARAASCRPSAPRAVPRARRRGGGPLRR